MKYSNLFPLCHSILAAILKRYELKQCSDSFTAATARQAEAQTGYMKSTRSCDYLAAGTWTYIVAQDSVFPSRFCKNTELSKCKSFCYNKVSVIRVYNFHFHLPHSSRSFPFVLIVKSHGSMGL